MKLRGDISDLRLVVAAVIAAAGALPLAAHAFGFDELWEIVFVAVGAAAAALLLWRVGRAHAHRDEKVIEHRYLRSVIDAIPHFIFARDSEGRFTLVNKAVADFYGLPVEQVEGRHLYDVHPDPAQARAWLDEDRETLLRGEPWSLPVTDTTQNDGRTIWIAAVKKPLPADIDGVAQVLGVSIDISEQMRAERALAARLDYEHTAAALFQTFVHCGREQMPQIMDRVLGRLGRFTEGSRAFLYRFDTGRGMAVRQYTWTDDHADDTEAPPTLLPMSDLDWLLGLFEMKIPVMSEDLRRHTTIPAGFRDDWGPDRAAFLAAPVIRDQQVFGFIGVDSDQARPWTQEHINLVHSVADLFITVWTKHEMERSLVQAREAAEASSRAKSEFLANMSHEIRTPMNSVIGLADLLSDMDPTHQQKQYLEMIRVSGSALLSLINDILDLSKIEAGQLELDAVETDLPALIDETGSLIAFTAHTAGLEFISRLAPGVPQRVLLDAHRLRQVLTNLLNNAVKFTQRGHVYLNVEPVGAGDGHVDLRFAVTDTGIGIPAHSLERIFEKFTQAEAGTTRRYGGTGLGLAISQQLVGLMGGTICATSEPGQGSTFSFTLRLPAVAAAANTQPVGGAPGAHVLIVTRHSLTGEVLLEKVRLLGHEGRVILGGPEALDQAGGWASATDRPFTHILFDHVPAADDPDDDDNDAALPDLRPYLARLAPRHDPRVILLARLTGGARDQDLHDHGFAHTLAKPVLTARLCELLVGDSLADTGATPCAAVAGSLPAGPATPATATESATADGQGPHVLLAEDNPFNQKVATAMLRLLGCRVEVAATGVEALAMARDGAFDLVLMDCQMPVMDGYEATRRIRGLPAPAGAVTIIAMTANAMSGDRKACFTAGMDDFLSKPITKAMLADMMRKWEIVAKMPEPVDAPAG
ncbi:MAG: response regulator [bacterium]|nr:response regulator [bacterium]